MTPADWSHVQSKDPIISQTLEAIHSETIWKIENQETEIRYGF